PPRERLDPEGTAAAEQVEHRRPVHGVHALEGREDRLPHPITGGPDVLARGRLALPSAGNPGHDPHGAMLAPAATVVVPGVWRRLAPGTIESCSRSSPASGPSFAPGGRRGTRSLC